MRLFGTIIIDKQEKSYLAINNTIFSAFLSRYRLPKPGTHYAAWWLKLRGLLRILAHHESLFEHTEAKLLHVTDVEGHDHTLAA